MIKATVIQDSISPQQKRITTFELEYPRFIHSEFMTHRALSRNAASSRAIPVESMLKHISDNPASPLHWGKNISGMQAKEELEGLKLASAQALWEAAAQDSVRWSRALANAEVHKQISNRVTEPFQTMKTVVTATELENLYWLRYHSDAQPEFFELAKLMRWVQDNSNPTPITPGEWHVPYVNRNRDKMGRIEYLDNQGNPIPLEDAKIISASCCAQVSYRKSDDTLEKARKIYDRMINTSPVHASPVEHQATPMEFMFSTAGPYRWEEGITHMQRDGSLCSGNFKGWIQFRQLIPNNVK